MNEPNLRKITFTSALIHFIFITLLFITIPVNNRSKKHEPLFVNIVEFKEKSKTLGSPPKLY
ncbi:MAG: hypothetical protein D6828_03095, partial [Nitrospirae bacterium]